MGRKEKASYTNPVANRQKPGLYATTQESRGPVGEDPEDTNPSAQEIKDSGSYGEL